ncbi:MAG: hypothetical protein QHC89_09165 [Bosea sp. (in: a-proteobacteria)]|nr:hypothetical protein [Bosea sp. (in: a-proteobacteria)]
MARFKCDACGFDGEREWAGQKACPECGEVRRLRVAIATNEMTDQEIERLEALLQEAPADR